MPLYQALIKPPSRPLQFTTSRRIWILLEMSFHGLDQHHSSVDCCSWALWPTVCKGEMPYRVLCLNIQGQLASNSLRVPAVPFFAFNVLCWGILEMCMAACTSFGGLFACRFLLGGCESLLIPAVTLVVSMWYRPEEQPKRNRYRMIQHYPKRGCAYY